MTTFHYQLNFKNVQYFSKKKRHKTENGLFYLTPKLNIHISIYH